MGQDDLYAVPSMVGAVSYVAIDYFGPQWIDVAVGSTLATVLRLMALALHWRLPTGPTELIAGQGTVSAVGPAGRPSVVAGYLANEHAQSIDAQGFLHTGDLAKVDADGCVYIVDRLEELINFKGYQVPPAELEALLLTHPAIADAAVIGVADDESGEEIPKRSWSPNPTPSSPTPR